MSNEQMNVQEQDIGELLKVRREKLAALQALIEELTGLLESKQKLNAYIKKCLLDVKRKYKSPRRTQILSGAPEKPITVEDF